MRNRFRCAVHSQYVVPSEKFQGMGKQCQFYGLSMQYSEVLELFSSVGMPWQRHRRCGLAVLTPVQNGAGMPSALHKICKRPRATPASAILYSHQAHFIEKITSWSLQSGNLAASFQGTGYNPVRRRTIYKIDNAALKAEKAAQRPQTPDTLKVDESTPSADQ